MPNKPTLLYWDSCVFISAIQETAVRYPTLKAILDSATVEKVILVTSALTIAEVVKLDRDSTDPDLLEADADKIRGFFENDYVVIWNVDRFIAESAGEIVRQYNIKPADAIHVATALRSKCSCLQTYDGDDSDPAANRKGLLRFDGKMGWPPLPIKPPSDPDDQSCPRLFQ